MDSRLEKMKNGFVDFISGLVLLVFSILVFVYGIYIINTMSLGKGVEWYTSPALMPLFIGAVIGVLSIMLMLKNKDSFLNFLNTNKVLSCKHVTKLNVLGVIINYKDNKIARFIITLFLLLLYVFVFIGRIPFLLATFIYLSSNMIVFRESDYAIWKLLFISLFMSLAINYGFGIVAKIPLP